MDQGSPPSPRTRDSLIGSAFAAVKNYFTPERENKPRPVEGLGITPLARDFASLTLDDSTQDTTDSFKTSHSRNDESFQSSCSFEYDHDRSDVAADTDSFKMDGNLTVIVEETLIDDSISTACSGGVENLLDTSEKPHGEKRSHELVVQASPKKLKFSNDQDQSLADDGKEVAGVLDFTDDRKSSEPIPLIVVSAEEEVDFEDLIDAFVSSKIDVSEENVPDDSVPVTEDLAVSAKESTQIVDESKTADKTDKDSGGISDNQITVVAQIKEKDDLQLTDASVTNEEVVSAEAQENRASTENMNEILPEATSVEIVIESRQQQISPVDILRDDKSPGLKKDGPASITEMKSIDLPPVVLLVEDSNEDKTVEEISTPSHVLDLQSGTNILIHADLENSAAKSFPSNVGHTLPFVDNENLLVSQPPEDVVHEVSADESSKPTEINTYAEEAGKSEDPGNLSPAIDIVLSRVIPKTPEAEFLAGTSLVTGSDGPRDLLRSKNEDNCCEYLPTEASKADEFPEIPNTLLAESHQATDPSNSVEPASINDLDLAAEQHVNSDSTPELLDLIDEAIENSEGEKPNLLTPIAEVREDSFLLDVSQTLSVDQARIIDNDLSGSIPNELVIKKRIMIESTPQPLAERFGKNNMSDVSPIVVLLSDDPASDADSPFTNKFLLNQAIIQSSPEGTVVHHFEGSDNNVSRPLPKNDSGFNCVGLMNATKISPNSALNETKNVASSASDLSESQNPPSALAEETKILSPSLFEITQTLPGTGLSESETPETAADDTKNLPVSALNETKTLTVHSPSASDLSESQNHPSVLAEEIKVLSPSPLEITKTLLASSLSGTGLNESDTPQTAAADDTKILPVSTLNDTKTLAALSPSASDLSGSQTHASVFAEETKILSPSPLEITQTLPGTGLSESDIPQTAAADDTKLLPVSTMNETRTLAAHSPSASDLSESQNHPSALAEETKISSPSPLEITKTLLSSSLSATGLNESDIQPTATADETKILPSIELSNSLLGKTEILSNSPLETTKINEFGERLNETKIVERGINLTQTFSKSPAINSTVTLEPNLDPTISLVAAVEKANLNVSRNALMDDTRENWDIPLKNTNKNFGTGVLREINDNVLENTMGNWFTADNKSPEKTLLNIPSNEIFSSLNNFDMLNVRNMPTAPINRESFFMNFDPLYQSKNLLDQATYKTAGALDLEGLQLANNEEKLSNEIERLKVLYNQREQETDLKCSEMQQKCEDVEQQCRGVSDSLATVEKRNLELQRDSLSLDVANAKIHNLSVQYPKVVEGLLNDVAERRKVGCPNIDDVIAERDSYKMHLKSAEAAFIDVSAKYEKLRNFVTDLKKRMNQREKEAAELCREAVRLDERLSASNASVKTSLDELQQTLNHENEQHNVEVTRLTAQLRKAELSLKHLQDRYDKTVADNEKIAALCDDIIAGKS